MNDCLLALNAGSSSLKFALFDSATLHCTGRGGADAADREFRFQSLDSEERFEARLAGTDFQRAALERLLEWLERSGIGGKLRAAGHRVVHGGTRFIEPVLVDAANLAQMDRLRHLAPLHLPANLAAIHLLSERLPELPQVACFDTMYHAGQSALARTYGLPQELSDAGYIRYGFHGLSYEYVATRLQDLFETRTADGRIIVAHLGNGASLCAMYAGRSVATTLGYSTLDGLLMGTRCGPLDPGLVLQLVRDHDGDVDTVERILYKQSGLAGVSGLSNDMRQLLASDDSRARFAVDLFVYRIVREIGSLSSALEGLDGLVFTGGIGYRAGEIRERVCRQLGWLGAIIDPQANAGSARRIESKDSGIAIACVETDEEAVIAAHSRRLSGA